MAWCIDTIASLATVLSTHSHISSCLWVKQQQFPVSYHKSQSGSPKQCLLYWFNFSFQPASLLHYFKLNSRVQNSLHHKGMFSPWFFTSNFHKSISLSRSKRQSRHTTFGTIDPDNTRRVIWSLMNLTHWGRDKMATISQTILSNAFSWMNILEFRLRFHWNLFLRVQLTIFQHWFI